MAVNNFEGRGASATAVDVGTAAASAPTKDRDTINLAIENTLVVTADTAAQCQDAATSFPVMDASIADAV